MIFFLGTHETSWLSKTDVPLCISARRLRRRATGENGLLRRPLVARGLWVLDSGGFSELSMYGEWRTPAEQYASEVLRWQSQIGNLVWAAVQDWMCEPFILAKTGLSVAEHQRRTVESYRALLDLAPGVPWLPVLQGWTHDDYLRHLVLYRDAGFDLASLPAVGLGSVCRRQDTVMAEDLIRELSAMGIRLHGFGFKLKGLARIYQHLVSADSMAWSFDARHSPPVGGHAHRSCANCLEFALAWRERVARLLCRPVQNVLW